MPSILGIQTTRNVHPLGDVGSFPLGHRVLFVEHCYLGFKPISKRHPFALVSSIDSYATSHSKMWNQLEIESGSVNNYLYNPEMESLGAKQKQKPLTEITK